MREMANRVQSHDASELRPAAFDRVLVESGIVEPARRSAQVAV